MGGRQEHLQIKFRLFDGSDIGPKKYPIASSVASLKQSIFAEWPQGKLDGPRTFHDLKLINAGMILENHKTLREYNRPIFGSPGEVTTMHIIVRPPMEKGAGRKRYKKISEPRCSCVIL